MSTQVLRAALSIYESDFERPPSSQALAYELVESDLQAIRYVVADGHPSVKALFSRLAEAHFLFTDALLANFQAASLGRAKPVPDDEIRRLHQAHADAISALRAAQN